jgi:DHA3 family macrolide efflux protein-like MFS transporter
MNQHNLNWKKSFAIIYAGQAFSIIGSSAVQFSILWWLTVETGSALTLTFAAIIGFLPQAIIGPFAGVLVDRYSRKKIMIIADGFVALSSAVLGIAFLLGTPSLGFVYVVLFFRALGATFHGPALQSAIPMLVPDDMLMKAGGWAQLVSAGSSMLGPAIGAGLTVIFPMQSIMLVDITGAVFAISALMFVKIPKLQVAVTEVHVWQDIKQGIRALRADSLLIQISIPVLLAYLLFTPLITLLPLLIYDHFQGTAWHNGLAQFLFAGGLLATSALIGVFGGFRKQFSMLAVSLLALGLFISACGLLPPGLFAAFAVFAFLSGCAGTCFYVPYMAYVQRTIPSELLGKVMALLISAMSFSTPIGLIVAGPVTELIGTNVWFLLSGMALVAVGIVCCIMIKSYEQRTGIVAGTDDLIHPSSAFNGGPLVADNAAVAAVEPAQEDSSSVECGEIMQILSEDMPK